MQNPREFSIELDGRRVDYRVVPSWSARQLRVRVGPHGVDVVQPTGRSTSDIESFLLTRAAWVLAQLQRAERLRSARRLRRRLPGQILYRGKPTRIRLEKWRPQARGTCIALVGEEIVVRRGGKSTTPAHRSLEQWLRAQARAAIEAHFDILAARLRRRPGRIYIMGQRTKWGNCSAKKNLSFNWRLILAPDFVFRYLVTHEAVHLAVPDHSAKFWLTVKSLCPETERAKQWLGVNNGELNVALERVTADAVDAKYLL